MADEEDYESRWEGYSQYEQVSSVIASQINDAIKAYSIIDSIHAEDAPMRPAIAARARSKILAAAIQLINEIENDADSVEYYQQVVDRWEGEDGFIRLLSQQSLQEECPGWLFQLVTDIRKCGWELGYLKAGRQNRKSPPDQDQAEVRAMFE